MRQPTVEAMRRWIAGEPIMSLEQQIEAWGEHYRSYRRTWPTAKGAQEALDATMREIPAEGAARGARKALDAIHNMNHLMRVEREALIREFGFALPNAEAIELLRRYAPLIKIGADSGAWARLLRDRGIEIVVTDPRIGECQLWAEDRIYCHGIIELQGKTAVRRWPDRNVFCSWPSLRETWLRQAARAMRPGRVLLAVVSDQGADERTWNYIEANFGEVAELELIGYHWDHDRLVAWKKRGGPHCCSDPH